MEPTVSSIPAVRVGFIYLRERKVLAVRPYASAEWTVPGGLVPAGESEESVLHREVHAQLNVALQEKSAMPFARLEVPAVEPPLTLACYSAVALGDFQPSAHVEEMGYLTSADRPRCAAAEQLLLDDLVAKGLVD